MRVDQDDDKALNKESQFSMNTLAERQLHFNANHDDFRNGTSKVGKSLGCF